MYTRFLRFGIKVLLSLAVGAYSLSAQSGWLFNSGSNALESAILTRAPNLDSHVLHLALEAYNKARAQGMVRQPYLGIIDYSKPSNHERFWVINLNTDAVLFNTYVAHGSGSGDTYATHFSNETSTHASAIGTYITGQTYVGHDGLSLHLLGVDRGFNDRAYSRAIVMHGAHYVSEAMAETYGRIGRSWGCPAVDAQLAKPIINVMKNGAMLFAYYPDSHWLNSSSFLS
jgi:hypothetical protein